MRKALRVLQRDPDLTSASGLEDLEMPMESPKPSHGGGARNPSSASGYAPNVRMS